MILNGLPWKWTEIIPSFLRLHPSTAFWNLLLTMMTTPFLLRDSCPQSFPASGSFKWVSSSHKVAKVLDFQLQNQSLQWTFRTDFFRMDWLDLLVVQGTLKSPFQHHSSKASILWHSAFFIDQLLHPYMTTGKTMAMTRRTFVGKVMSAF